MRATDQLLANAQNYAAGFHGADLQAAPAMKVAVVACMDARLIPRRVLGLREGDAHVRGFVYDVHSGRLHEVL